MKKLLPALLLFFLLVGCKKDEPISQDTAQLLINNTYTVTHISGVGVAKMPVNSDRYQLTFGRASDTQVNYSLVSKLTGSTYAGLGSLQVVSQNQIKMTAVAGESGTFDLNQNTFVFRLRDESELTGTIRKP